MSIERVRRAAVVALLATFGLGVMGAGCSDDDAEKGSDAPLDGGATDSGTEPDGGLDFGAPGPNDAEFDLSIEFGGESVDFERAYYGVTAPRNSNTERWELYIEAYAGGADGCPSEGSPTPDQTLIVSGAAFPDDATVTTDSEGLAVSLLDFSGELTDAPVESARDEESTVVSWQVCRECDSDPEGFVVLDLNAPFTVETATAEGEASGRIVATHCQSLDAR